VLVVRGEPGVGKSALLEYVAERAADCRVGRAAGVQSEMELAFAGLQQLCAPMLDRLERPPALQRDALPDHAHQRAEEALLPKTREVEPAPALWQPDLVATRDEL
jgi:hypothetical protein